MLMHRAPTEEDGALRRIGLRGNDGRLIAVRKNRCNLCELAPISVTKGDCGGHSRQKQSLEETYNGLE